jgi:hypothetical protein
MQVAEKGQQPEGKSQKRKTQTDPFRPSFFTV